MNYKKQHIDLLLLACKKQDQKAQMELYQRYYKNTYHAAFSILKNREDAMDAMQEAFIKAWLNRKQFRDDANWQTWIYRITINTCLLKIKQEKKMLRNLATYLNTILT